MITLTSTNLLCNCFTFFQVDCENLSNLSLSTIPVHCPKLTSFDLKGVCYVTDYGVIPLTTNSNLKSLHLAEAAVTDSTLETVAKGCGGKVTHITYQGWLCKLFGMTGVD